MKSDRQMMVEDNIWAFVMLGLFFFMGFMFRGCVGPAMAETDEGIYMGHSDIDKWGKPRDWKCKVCNRWECGRTVIPAVMTYDEDDFDLQRKIDNDKIPRTS